MKILFELTAAGQIRMINLFWWFCQKK